MKNLACALVRIFVASASPDLRASKTDKAAIADWAETDDWLQFSIAADGFITLWG